MAKSTRAEVERRVSEVYNWLLVGADRQRIVQFGTGRWSVTPRMVDKYIHKANQLIVEQAAVERGVERSKAKARYELLFRELVALKDFRGAATVQEKLDKLLGLLAPSEQTVRLVNAVWGDTLPLVEAGEALRAAGFDPVATLNAIIAQAAAERLAADE